MFFNKKQKTTATIMQSLTSKVQELKDHEAQKQEEILEIEEELNDLYDKKAEAVTETLNARGFIRGLEGLFVSPETVEVEDETEDELWKEEN